MVSSSGAVAVAFPRQACTHRTMSLWFLVATLLAMLCALAMESCKARICSSSAEADFLSLRTMRRKEVSCSLVESAGHSDIQTETARSTVE